MGWRQRGGRSSQQGISKRVQERCAARAEKDQTSINSLPPPGELEGAMAITSFSLSRGCAEFNPSCCSSGAASLSPFLCLPHSEAPHAPLSALFLSAGMFSVRPPTQHLSTWAFPAFPCLVPRTCPGRASGSLPAASLQRSGTACSPLGSNPHISATGWNLVQRHHCPGVGRNDLFCGAGVSRQGLVQCEVVFLQCKFEIAWKQLCFLHCPGQGSALPALAAGMLLATLLCSHCPK